MATSLDRTIQWNYDVTSNEASRHATPSRETVRGGYCSRCKRLSSGRFCAECGGSVTQQARAHCPHCGSETRGRFCTQCGRCVQIEADASLQPSLAIVEDLRRHRARLQPAPSAQVPAVVAEKIVIEQPHVIYPSPPELPVSQEIFRQIYVALKLPVDEFAVIGVTSAIAGEGRTTCAVGLARTLAGDLHTPVLLVEADLERPSLASHFGISPGPGLADVLRGSCSLAGAMQMGAERLFVVTAGSLRDDTAGLIHQLSLHDPIRVCSYLAGIVILDLPPLLNHGYSSSAARLADSVVLVVRAGVTPVNLLQEAVGRLGERKPQGVVLNGASSSLPPWVSRALPS